MEDRKSNLDINTPEGQKSLKQESKMLNYIKKKWKVDIIETDKEDSASCDGFLVKKNIIKAVFESKCRNLTLNELENFGSWLITYKKLEEGAQLSKLLKVPFIGFLNLNYDDLTMYWKITNKEGNFLFNFKTEETITQKNINGGKITRLNAFLPVSEGKFII